MDSTKYKGQLYSCSAPSYDLSNQISGIHFVILYYFGIACCIKDDISSQLLQKINMEYVLFNP